jgi:hypothetical protein
MLAISRSSVYNVIDADQLTPVRISQGVRFPVEQLSASRSRTASCVNSTSPLSCRASSHRSTTTRASLRSSLTPSPEPSRGRMTSAPIQTDCMAIKNRPQRRSRSCSASTGRRTQGINATPAAETGPDDCRYGAGRDPDGRSRRRFASAPVCLRSWWLARKGSRRIRQCVLTVGQFVVRLWEWTSRRAPESTVSPTTTAQR